MSLKPFFYPYNISTSCKALSRMIGGKRIKLGYSKYKPKPNHLIINWGNSTQPAWFDNRQVWLNHPLAVAIASNKLKTLRTLQHSMEGFLPAWSTTRCGTGYWLDQGWIVYCRTQLQGHSGSGIVIASSPEEIVDAPLYTLKYNSTCEYRVHVFNGVVIDWVKKGRRRGESPSSDIRSYAYGWVFIREVESVIPSWVEEKCVQAVGLLGLDFGAVDVGYNKNEDTCCIFEVNTAPGFEQGSITCNSYARAIREVLFNV